ncbi:hypothetical protein LSTR_LSTR012605 [Laodelphax striatellus]|uniref:Uncharacterized protein n=1 Tax=Laodelphax striatellus TaxID=195883 RepID=A0A482XH54_LAOST|nr:hypothetical protein LSTR_LSTR012605 [Laodelphax striatellus]
MKNVSETRIVDKCGKDYSSHDGEISSMELFRQVSLFAVKEPEVVVDQSDDACLLSPRRGNLHEIHTVDGPAAFVDILSPPYDTDIPGVGPRPCRYFREVSHPDDNLVKKLIRIPSPSDYWSDTAPYTGPPCNSTDE